MVPLYRRWNLLVVRYDKTGDEEHCFGAHDDDTHQNRVTYELGKGERTGLGMLGMRSVGNSSFCSVATSGGSIWITTGR